MRKRTENRKIGILFLIILLVAGCVSKSNQLMEYYASGELKKTYQLNSDGKMHGFVQEYHKNGVLASEGNWDNGNMNGEFKFYFENGDIKEQHWRKDGLLDGCAKYYLKGERIIKTACFDQGMKHGSFIEYDSLGDILTEDRFNYDTLFYSKLLIGEKTFQVLRPIIYDRKDSVKLDERFTFKVKFGVDVKGEYKFYIGSDIRNNQLTDTIQVLTKQNDYQASIQPKSIGENYVAILVEHESSRDSVSGNGILIKHRFTVR